MAVSLNEAVLDAIRAHGRETYPNECCGALIGRDGVVTTTESDLLGRVVASAAENIPQGAAVWLHLPPERCRVLSG